MSLRQRVVASQALLRNRTIRWLVISRFLDDLFFFSTTIVLFQHQRGLNFTEMFLMETILAGAIWVADIPTSIIADRIGYRQLIIVGHAVNIVSIIVFTLAHGFWLFAIANMLNGFKLACTSGCESALAYQSLPAVQRSKQGSAAFALLGMASRVGFFWGLLTGSFIGAYSPTLAVAISIIPIVLAFLAALRLPVKSLPGTQYDSEVSPALGKIVRLAWQTVIAQPRLVLLSIFRTLTFAVANAIFWYNQPYFERAGIPVVLFGPLMAAAMGMQFLLLWRMAHLQKWLGTRLLLLLFCVLPGGAYMLLTWNAGAASSVLLVVIIAACAGCPQPLIENELNKQIPDASRATTLSALSWIGSCFGMIANPLIGHIGDMGLGATSIGLGMSMLMLSVFIPFLMNKKEGHFS